MLRKNDVVRFVIAGIIAIVVVICAQKIVNNAIYSSLEKNLKDTLMLSDKQKVEVLEKQFSVFFTSMEGYGISIAQLADDFDSMHIKIRILLADLEKEIHATGLGIIDEKGRGISGMDVNLDEYEGLKKALKGENVVTLEAKGPSGESACLVFAVPIKSVKKNKSYVLYASIDRQFVSSVFTSFKEYNEQEIMVIDEYGEVVFPMNDKKVQEDIFESYKKIKPCKEGEKITKNNSSFCKNGTAIEKIESMTGKEYYVDTVKLDANGWYLVSVVPTKEASGYIKYASKMANIVMTCVFAVMATIVMIISLLVHKSKNEIFDIAYRDKLTKIYNWEYMQVQIKENIKNVKSMILVVFDISGLKLINDIYGFETGDILLKKVAEFLRVNRFDSNGYYMYGKVAGDTFAIVVDGELDDKFIVRIKGFITELKKYVKDICDVNFSTGITPIEYEDKSNYQRDLDNAFSIIDNIKKQPGLSLGVYSQKIKEEKVFAKKLENDLGKAIDNEELQVYLQPKYNAKKEEIVGAEALVRWEHSELGFINPGQFISIFEGNGKIDLIDQYVLEQVCKKMVKWKQEGKKLLPIAINISRIEINDRKLVYTLKNIVKKYGVDPSLIEFEVTESALSDNMDQLISNMHELTEYGFNFAMDDFGTGYSSLAQLMKMPLHTLKLDKSFIDNYSREGQGSHAHVFICDVITIAKHITCKVVAEGVENKAQRDMLVEAGCDIIQGFYYDKPMPIEKYEEKL